MDLVFNMISPAVVTGIRADILVAIAACITLSLICLAIGFLRGVLDDWNTGNNSVKDEKRRGKDDDN